MPLLVKATKVVRSVGFVGFWVYLDNSEMVCWHSEFSTPLFVLGSGNLLRKKFVSPLLLHRSSIDLKQENATVIAIVNNKHQQAKQTISREEGLTCHAKLRVLNQVGRNRRKAPITFSLQYFFLCVFFLGEDQRREKSKGSKKENNNTKHKEKQAKA